MAKLFAPSVRCPICCHANDSDFRYCQCCGYKRKVICPSRVGQVGVNVDLTQIDKRLQQLLNYDQATSYSKQKDSLQKQLEVFLSALPGQVTLATVTPRDLCRFLIFKDKDGKTQVHCNGCKFIGQQGRHLCACPQRLSYKTVDSYIGKLRSIFHADGRDGEWDKRLGLGNPAADKSVKDYLRLVSAEQLQARITPKQATPFFVDKLTMLSLHLQRELENCNPTVHYRSFKLTSRRPSLVAIDLVTWVRSKFLKFYVSQITTGFCLIMFGGKL